MYALIYETLYMYVLIHEYGYSYMSVIFQRKRKSFYRKTLYMYGYSAKEKVFRYIRVSVFDVGMKEMLEGKSGEKSSPFAP